MLSWEDEVREPNGDRAGDLINSGDEARGGVIARGDEDKTGLLLLGGQVMVRGGEAAF